MMGERSAHAATGDVLVEYKAQLRTLPSEQGWTHVGHCLSETCPGVHYYPDIRNYVCYYQGWWDGNTDGISDNSCLLGVGCRKSSGILGPGEHYNAPEPDAEPGTCTYSEWIAFDNGHSPTHGLRIFDSLVAGSPPWGAMQFVNAPSSYPPLRIVTGDGNLVPDSLPVASTSAENHRNLGRAEVNHLLTVPDGVTSITLLCKMAVGPRPGNHAMVCVNAWNRRFAFSVDGDETSLAYGRLLYGLDASGNMMDLMFDRSVIVAQPNPSTTTSHVGEFFTLRVVLRSDGTFNAYLNETLSLAASGAVPEFADVPMVRIAPDTDDATLWVDYVQVLEGKHPLACPQPVFDVNSDGKVNQVDMNMFFSCVTGPGNANGNWVSLSPVCQCLDFNDDQSIDMVDFAALQRCLTIVGTSNADPACAD